MYWYSIDLSGWGTPLTFYNGVFVIHFLFFFFNFFVNFVITSFPFWSPRRDKEELGMKQTFFLKHMFSDWFLSESNTLQYYLQAILNYRHHRAPYRLPNWASSKRVILGRASLWFTKIFFTFEIFFPQRMLSAFKFFFYTSYINCFNCIL